MANFSTDQVRQLYVVDNIKSSALVPTDVIGTTYIQSTADDVWISYMTPNGQLTVNGDTSIVRSDLIPIKNITKAVASPPKRRNLQLQQLVLDPTINGGLPVVGQEYMIRLTFYGLGIGKQENQYIRGAGSYRVRPGDTVATVLENLAAIAKINLSREAFPYCKITTDTYDPFTMAAMPGTSTRLIVEEVPQPWIRGKRQADQVNFQVQAVTINYNGFMIPWGIVTDITATNANYIGNGRMTCDMEYFYLGERGDVFRGMGYPDNFVAKYLADPNTEYGFLDIEYFYIGDKEDANPRSKKFITLVWDWAAVTQNDVVTPFVNAGVNVEIR